MSEPATQAAPAKKKPRLLDESWPHRGAVVLFCYAVFILVIATVPPWRAYFNQNNDAVSMLTIPVVPNAVYAAVLFSLGAGLQRRLRAAWWFAFIWLLLLPQIGRAIDIVLGLATVAEYIGVVLMATVMVLAVRVKPQFRASLVRGNFRWGLAVLLIGSAVTIGVGTWLISMSVASADGPTAALSVANYLLGDLGRSPAAAAIEAPLWVRAITGTLGAATILTATYLLFRAPRSTRTLASSSAPRVRVLRGARNSR